ncbi:MAG: sigma-70 family RNA polymerase sigma factor [Hespellia sp.]|nr:sigma-70 family RNA polymerase sigma factor [Hespellia sp.]
MIAQTRLTPQQQTLVEEHLPLVSKVLKEQISYDQSIPGIEYHDLYQAGCLALCKAALCYDPQKPFTPYAATVIRHAVIDYCKKCTYHCKQMYYPRDTISEDQTIWDILEDMDQEKNPLTHAETAEALTYLENAAKKSHGSLRNGIYSLLQKVYGRNSTDISKQFGVTSNTVRAWMSLATKELRNNPELYDLLSK